MANTYNEQILALVQRLGTEFKKVYGEIGNLTTLETIAKDNLVAAVNELFNKFKEEEETLTALIDDTAPKSDKVYSSQKTEDIVNTAKQAVKDEILNGAGDAYDTLKEIQTALEGQSEAIEALKALSEKKYVLTQVQSEDTTETYDVYNTNKGNGIKVTTESSISHIAVTKDNIELSDTEAEGSTGVRIILKSEGAFYTKEGTDATTKPQNEIATLADLGVTEEGTLPDLVSEFEKSLSHE